MSGHQTAIATDEGLKKPLEHVQPALHASKLLWTTSASRKSYLDELTKFVNEAV